MLTITPIKAFDDNYIWAILQPSSRQAIVIDPGQAEPVIEFMTQSDWQLHTIWITHKHFDHVGGVQALQTQYPDVRVVAHANHGVAHTHEVTEGSEFVAFADNKALEVKVWHVAGHTENHLAYLLKSSDSQSLDSQNLESQSSKKVHVFCGDTLFSGGCGRVFTGDMSAMYNSLQRLANIDTEMAIAEEDIFFYPAHEYTASNLKFGLHIEAENTAIRNHLEAVEQLNNQGKASLPTSLALEKKINVFLRTDKTTVIEKALKSVDNQTDNNKIANKNIENHSEEAVFSTLRKLKDSF